MWVEKQQNSFKHFIRYLVDVTLISWLYNYPPSELPKNFTIKITELRWLKQKGQRYILKHKRQTSNEDKHVIPKIGCQVYD